MSKRIKMDFPKIVTVEHQKGEDNPFRKITNEIAGLVHEDNYKGVIDKNGKFLIDCGFICEKLNVGEYKVTHGLGFSNLALSVCLLEPPGTLTIRENHTHYFVVNITVDKKPKDKEFTFTLTKAISLSAPQ